MKKLAITIIMIACLIVGNSFVFAEDIPQANPNAGMPPAMAPAPVGNIAPPSPPANPQAITPQLAPNPVATPPAPKTTSVIARGKITSKKTPIATKKVKEEETISFDFDKVDIRVFIKFMSELTGKNFLVDEQVRGKITVISPNKISKDEAYRVFETVLEFHGYSMVQSGKLTKILPAQELRRMNIDTTVNKNKVVGEPNEEIVTHIIPIKFADVNEVLRLFTPLVSKNGMLLAYQPTNTLFLTDTYSNITRLLKILKTIDIEGVEKSVIIIPLQNSNAAKLVKIVSAVFVKQGAQKETMQLVADTRANTIIAIASEAEIPKIEKVVEKLDRPAPAGTEKVSVYYLENAAAEELAAVLQGLMKTSSGEKAGVISDKVQITPDKSTNSLIITADKEDYVVVESIIKQLDMPKDMVYIESLIMEVEAGESFSLDASLMGGGTYDSQGRVIGGFSGQGDSAATMAVGSGLGTTPASLSGFSMGIFSDSITVGNMKFPNLASAISAFKKKTGYNILSTPQILTLNNEAAKISVGDNIPYTTKAASTVEGSYAYEYKDVGVVLNVTPQISKEKKVRLKIYQEVKNVSSISTNSSQDIRLPATKTRTIDTSVVVNSGATVVIGGLIQEEATVNKSSVPCLGDIPILGFFFRGASESKKKSNLYVFITPHIVTSSNEVQSLYDKKKKEADKLRNESISLFSRFKDKDDKPLTVKYEGQGNKGLDDKGLNAAEPMPAQLKKYETPSNVDAFIDSIGKAEYDLEEETP